MFSWYILLASMSVLTVLFFFDIKFMVAGLNIIAWDMLAGGIWIFVKLCKWAGRENTGKRTLAIIAITIAGAFTVFSLAICGGLPGYIEGTEPQTRRTFVVEYERFGPLLLACDVEEYKGEFLHARPEERQIYISEEGEKFVVAYFFLRPVFSVPLE